ncbi:hypothetical protein C8J56DRAFT_927750 [Mycena floridula]|nr:hypothetical protein C8J56DRAFT_927750 [Mycena floridula]
MSTSLGDPWISDYVVNIAESFGANLGGSPLYEKNKRVQIVEFLTFAPDHQVPSSIWAKVSDKFDLIPIKFTKDSVALYFQQEKKRLTEVKTALISIQEFKLILARIPLSRGGRTGDRHLALECNKFKVLGSQGDMKWGDPKDVEQNQDINDWRIGLSKDGGDGNILKDRKEQIHSKPVEITRPLQQTSLASLKKVSPKETTTKLGYQNSLLLSKTRNVEPVAKVQIKFSRGPNRVIEQRAKQTIDVDDADDTGIPSLPDESNIERTVFNPLEPSLSPVASEASVPISNWGSSRPASPNSPTPGQRQRTRSCPRSPDRPGVSSFVHPFSANQIDVKDEPESPMRPRSPSSSPPLPAPSGNRSHITPTPSSQSNLRWSQIPALKNRKVPRPVHIKRNTGSPKILVPNSDSSQSLLSQLLSQTASSQPQTRRQYRSPAVNDEPESEDSEGYNSLFDESVDSSSKSSSPAKDNDVAILDDIEDEFEGASTRGLPGTQQAERDGQLEPMTPSRSPTEFSRDNPDAEQSPSARRRISTRQNQDLVFHDPVAWQAPSFLRAKTNTKLSSIASSAKKRRRDLEPLSNAKKARREPDFRVNFYAIPQQKPLLNWSEVLAVLNRTRALENT